MRIIDISSYNHNTMKLSQPVYDSKKRILLAAGRHIHPKYLERLEQMGINYLIVEDDVSKGITLDELIDMPTWMDAIEVLQKIYDQVKQRNRIDLYVLQQMVRKLLLEVRKRQALVLVPATSISNELKEFAHAVNVALLSLQIGKKLQLNEMMLRDLALGALLHDVGKAVTDNESDHPKAGFEILRNNREIHLVSAHVAFQHHEALNGSGAPRGIKGKEFHDFAQICGVANIYENLVSKEGVSPNEAMEIIMSKSGEIYDTKVIEAFVRGVPSYPPGTKVNLNTGDTAIVTKIETHMQRPVIRMIESGNELSLTDHPTMIISGILDESEE